MRLIDADAFKKENERLLHCDFPYLSETTLEELIDAEPTVDAVSVIRCKDCAMSRKTVNKSVVVCIRHGFGTHEDPDGYCYKAKRREDNDKTD